MEKSEFRRKLLSLVIPITMQQLMLSLVNVSDAVMLGFLNQDSLSAVSLAGQVQFVFNLFVFSVTGGISILAAQYWGINDKTSNRKNYRHRHEDNDTYFHCIFGCIVFMSPFTYEVFCFGYNSY